MKELGENEEGIPQIEFAKPLPADNTGTVGNQKLKEVPYIFEEDELIELDDDTLKAILTNKEIDFDEDYFDREQAIAYIIDSQEEEEESNE